MAIQTQWYPNNSASSPFWNNGHCAPGFMDSGISFQHKQQQQLAEQHLGELCNGSQGGAFDPNLHVCSSKGMNSPMFAIQFEKQWGEIDQYMKSEVRIHSYTTWLLLLLSSLCYVIYDSKLRFLLLILNGIG